MVEFKEEKMSTELELRTPDLLSLGANAITFALQYSITKRKIQILISLVFVVTIMLSILTRFCIHLNK